MKFTIKTAKLLAMLSTTIKGTGNKYNLPITEYFQIKLSDKGLEITATNTTNFITYLDSSIKGVGEAVVKADTLYKLVSKTTKEDITLSLKEKVLEVVGNGKYKLEVIEANSFPSYKPIESEVSDIISVKELKRALNKNMAAVAKEQIVPFLTGFVLSDNVITTDGIKMCINEVSVLQKPLLLSQSLASLIGTLTDDKAEIIRGEGKLEIKTGNITIFGAELAGLEDYPDIKPILDIPYTSSLKVSKDYLLKALDRLELFVDSYDNDGVCLSIKEDKLLLQDLKKNSVEEVIYESKEGSEDLDIIVSIIFLKEILMAMESQHAVTISYSEGMPLKLSEDKTVFVLSLIDKEGE